MTAALPVFASDVARHIHYLTDRNPARAVRGWSFLGLTPREYRDAVTDVIRAKVRAWEAEHGRRTDGGEWTFAVETRDLPTELQARIQAANDRHVARQRARQSSTPTPTLAERLNAYRAAFRYGISTPREKAVTCRFKTREAAIKAVEQTYAPGYTTEPWVQLIAQSPLERRLGVAHVVAEWETARAAWRDPLTAAGYFPRTI